MNQLYLIHHGIQGQKWGVTNGPPYPLDKSDYSAAEKKAQKKFAKNLQKAEHTLGGYSKKDTAIKEEIRKTLTQKDIDDLNKASEELDKAFNADEEFMNSDEYIKSVEYANKQTYDWWEKNKPEELQSMLEQVDGEPLLLDQFHDFRKMDEGYASEAIHKAKMSYRSKNGTKSREDAMKNYSEVMDGITKKMLGEYSDKYINDTLIDKIANVGKTRSRRMNYGDYLQYQIADFLDERG